MDFHGPNAAYALELYERYQQDPMSVDAATREIFEGWTPPEGSDSQAESAPVSLAAPAASVCSTADMRKIVTAARYARLVRELGHLAARIDPLGGDPPGDPGLDPATHGLQEADLAALPASVVGGPLAEESRNMLEAIEKLCQVYSGSIGYEDDHIQIAEERRWLREAVETSRFFQGFETEEKRALLERLTEVEALEQFIHKTFANEKRFSLEGNDMLVPMLDTIIRTTAATGTREVVMGMAHRGRLNVLTHILGKPYASILGEFKAAKQKSETGSSGGGASDTGALGYSGDVKYHMGARRTYTDDGEDEMPVTLAPNPSHLEFVNPVVLGRARAAQEQRDDRGYPIQNLSASLPILIHGDAAFPGQGIVAESLNLSQLPGFRVGGTIHIIVNNQIGFTTVPRDSRSTLYASDLAKGFEIPTVHVNADDPAACIAAARMACAYRERFGKDFLIDLVGYRRYGHNEGDEPAFTQPRIYEFIASHPTVRQLWAKELERQDLVTPDEAETLMKAAWDRLQKALDAPPSHDIHLWAQEMERRGVISPGEAQAMIEATKARLQKVQNHLAELGTEEEEAISRNGSLAAAWKIDTSVPVERLRELNEALLVRPERFTVNTKLEGILQRRRTVFEKGVGVDWGHAEALAFGSILQDGTPIRLTGQDSERGTFGHRNLVLHDPTTGQRYSPMVALPDARASFALFNSPLSENAVLGFEYGYSMHAEGALVLWEAQFGDFVNGAQVIVDQFLVSGNVKWQQTPSLVLLLPHGYEGMGPEHSNARPERFLQLAADDNIRVANCTTAAQYFHLLRRQAALVHRDPRPLIVMTPKSLLRSPRATSSVDELAEGRFEPVLLDRPFGGEPESVTRLVLCSGKVYVDLIGTTNEQHTERLSIDGISRVAVARVEELYPFPTAEVERALRSFPALREVVWLQEEPRNMGAWFYMEPRLRDLLPRGIDLRYAGRSASASPAEGSRRRHAIEQSRIIADALNAVPAAPAEKKMKTHKSEVVHAG